MVEDLQHSRSLEQAIIGACLLERTAYGRTRGILAPENFYFEDHRKIYAVLSEMYELGQPLDILTATVFLNQKGVVLTAGGTAWYLVACTRDVCSSAHLEFHCLLVADMWRMRELEKITMSGINPLGDIRAQITEITEKVQALQGKAIKREWVNAEELMQELVEHQSQVKQNGGNFITTGFKKIDQINGGFSGNQFVIVGARPSVGKTALLAKISREVARSGVGVGIISLETDNVRIAARMAAQDTGVSFQTIYRNLFRDEDEQRRWFKKVSNTAKLPIYVSDKTKVDINEIRAKAAKLAKLFERAGIANWVIALDYLQLVETSSNKTYNREQEISKISRGCKLLASEFNKVVIGLSQLSRESSKRTGRDRYPKLSDLRESGSLEQDADIVLMLHRDWASDITINEAGGSTEREADLIGVKWRDGSPFKIKLDYDAETMTFSEVFNQPNIGNWKPVPAEPIEKDEEGMPF
jgi:replicative DNA helicase